MEIRKELKAQAVRRAAFWRRGEGISWEKIPHQIFEKTKKKRSKYCGS